MVVLVPAVFASDAGPEIAHLKNGKKEKNAVTFPHKKHADESLKGKQEFAKYKYTDDYTCAACHHKTKKGETPKKCISCKDEKAKEKLKLKKYMHGSCKDGCHKKMGNKELKKKKCKLCHPKKKK
jgi:DnaJ-class molecular chaperone